MKSFIPFFKINYDHNEIREIKSVLNSGMLTMGSKTDLFENKIAKKLNIKKIMLLQFQIVLWHYI